MNIISSTRLERILVILALIFAVSTTAFAQTNLASTPTSAPATTTGQTEQQILKPQMTVSDVLFTLEVLSKVTVNGSEVEAFLDVKRVFSNVLDQAQKEKKGENDMLTVEMSVLTANNFLSLFQRANVPGAAAEKFQGVKNSLFASAKPAQGSTTNTSKK
jgi:hypothetical protein